MDELSKKRKEKQAKDNFGKAFVALQWMAESGCSIEEAGKALDCTPEFLRSHFIALESAVDKDEYLKSLFEQIDEHQENRKRK